ncbi:mitochondrial protein Pet127-domain-containing protein [Trametes gibbosa]|nr:mitochondrial protein Pet127-domain-containing protein [Trametes gibbosa]
MRCVKQWSVLAPASTLRHARTLRIRHISTSPTSPFAASTISHANTSENKLVDCIDESAVSDTTPNPHYNVGVQLAARTLQSLEDLTLLNAKKGKGKQRKPKVTKEEPTGPTSSSHDSHGILTDSFFKPLKDIRPGSKKLVPKLQHGLDAVLKTPGVHWVQDPESGEYNLPQYLENIPRVADFAFDRLPGFKPSSQDKTMVNLAKKNNCRFAGSTSSLTGILAQIYLLISEEKYISVSNLGPEFQNAPRYFTPGQRIPVSVKLHYQDGVYTTDYDSERDESTDDIILLPMASSFLQESSGLLLEKFFTLPKNDFDKFRKSYTSRDYLTLKDTHRYAKHGDFLMRSQLDCREDSLPGTGVFDLKTRAISAIRHDVHNYLSYLDHKIESLTGRRGSFEEEYYDMIRAAFLEYSFQARIGNMDGVLVAYHNTARIFGFQYVSLHEMDTALFGRAGVGDRVFLRCVALMERLYREIVQAFPARSVKVTFEKRSNVVRAWVQPLENPDSDADPPVVELQLSLTNLMRGRRARGQYAVFSESPWTVQYRIVRSQQSQEEIIENRNRAYRRQMSIAHSPPTQHTAAIDAAVLLEDPSVSDVFADTVFSPGGMIPPVDESTV